MSNVILNWCDSHYELLDTFTELFGGGSVKPADDVHAATDADFVRRLVWFASAIWAIASQQSKSFPMAMATSDECIFVN